MRRQALRLGPQGMKTLLISSRVPALAVVVVLLAALAGGGSANAVVPPKNCGMMSVKSRLYNIKADQLRCRRARRYARTYLSEHQRPSGYSCRDYGRSTSIKFRCTRSVKVFFAIRR